MKKTSKENTTMLYELIGQTNMIPSIPGTYPDEITTEFELVNSLAPLGEMLPDAMPPENLFEQIEAELDAEPSANVEVRRSNEGSWEQRNEKIWKKILSHDPLSGRSMYLLRCLPGAEIQPHYHERAEHLFIVEGELWMDGQCYKAGDSQFSKAGTEHHKIEMPHGCLVVITA